MPAQSAEHVAGLWLDYFSHPSQWWDIRKRKVRSFIDSFSFPFLCPYHYDFLYLFHPFVVVVVVNEEDNSPLSIIIIWKCMS